MTNPDVVILAIHMISVRKMAYKLLMGIDIDDHIWPMYITYSRRYRVY